MTKHIVLKRKARVRRQVMTYFASEEMPPLEKLMKQEKRNASDLIRWLVREYESGGLVRAGKK